QGLRSLPSERVKLLIVSMYFPPAGGGGVQRTLKTATHLPALGIETHVLAPADPKGSPPAGGAGGVQRPRKTARPLPALGIETHVLAPDDPKWIHRDDELQPPTQAWIHRARYVGPRGRLPAQELHGTQGLERFGLQARLFGRRLLVPDENVTWNVT